MKNEGWADEEVGGSGLNWREGGIPSVNGSTPAWLRAVLKSKSKIDK